MLHSQTVPLAQAFAQAGVVYWLIGGNAIEALCSEVCGGHVRDHDDIDFLVRVQDGPKALSVLAGLGFTPHHGSLEQGDVFYRREDLLVDIVPVLENPPRTLGELAVIQWPAHFLDPHVAQVQGVHIQTLTPAMHRAMKGIVAAYYGVELRPKDQLDLEALSALG